MRQRVPESRNANSKKSGMGRYPRFRVAVRQLSNEHLNFGLDCRDCYRGPLALHSRHVRHLIRVR